MKVHCEKRANLHGLDNQISELAGGKPRYISVSSNKRHQQMLLVKSLTLPEAG